MACCNKKRPVLVGAIILIVIAYITSLMDTPAPISSETQTPSNQVNGIGTLEAKEIITISPKYASKIGAIYADEGQSVTKGESLAKMELSEPTGVQTQNSATIEKSREPVSLDSVNTDYSLRSPIDGIVISREAEAGSKIGAGVPVFKIANPKTLWVRAYMDERQSGPLQVGQQAIVTLRSTGEQKYTGIVRRIGVISDHITEERVVYITLDQLPIPFSLGEQAEVQINLSHN